LEPLWHWKGKKKLKTENLMFHKLIRLLIKIKKTN